MANNWRRFPVTLGLAMVTAIISLGLMLFNTDQVAPLWGVVPARLSGLLILSPAVPTWLTPLSATLIHGGLLHLAVNLVMLVWVGRQVEGVYGAPATLFVYVLGAYAAGIAQWAVAPASLNPMIGASGAISAWFGIYALAFSRPKPVTRSPGLNRAIHALWMLAAWILLQMANSYMASSGGGMTLATAAHVGGFVIGMLVQRPLLLWRYRSA